MPTPRRRLLALICAGALCLTACGGSTSSAGTGGTPLGAASNTPAPSTTTARRTAPPRETHAQIVADVTKATRALIAKQPDGAISVAELNTVTGARYQAGATSGMWTASTYKLLLLVSLMLRNGGDGGDEDAAEDAIENSNNVAGYQLFLANGSNAGMQSAFDRLGMSHSVPGATDPTFTRTSAMDYLKVLQALVDPGLLTKNQGDYAIGLMQQVESDQRWGVGVVADKGDDFANKNGWLSITNNGPGESDNGLWAVNSVGIVRVHGQRVLMAIFTEHDPDFATGVHLVETLARTIVPVVQS